MEFASCQRYFQKLVSECALPPKMEVKLHYLEAAISKREGSEYLRQLPEFEQDSLREMNAETQKAMFVDIINCFAYSETRQHFKQVKAKVKRLTSNSDSSSLYLTCIGNRLAFYKKRNNVELWKEFKLQSIEISQLYQKSKKKYTFTLNSGKSDYEIRFEEERACAGIHGQLWNLITEFKSSSQRPRYEKQAESEVIQQQKIFSEFDQEAYFVEEERNYLRALKKNAEAGISECEGSFKLLRNITNGKLEVSPTGAVRLLLFVEKCEVRRYIESFILLDCWNTQFETFRIVKLIRPNTFLAYIRLKKISVWTAQREAYVSISYLKDCSCLEQKEPANQQARNSYKCLGRHFVIMNSVDYQEGVGSGLAKMNFNQIAQFSEIEDPKDSIFLSLTSNVDPKTYEFMAAKADLNANLLNDVPALTTLYKEKTIQNATFRHFDFDRCPCNLHLLGREPPLNEVNEGESEIVSSPSILDSISNLRMEASRPQQEALSSEAILKVISDESNYIKNERIIEIIKQKTHEAYYLKERFSLDVNESPYVQSNWALDHDQEFLIQGGRWKFNTKEDYIFIDEEELKVQKGMLKLLIKQITSNILAGKSIMTMSLPVEIFGPESLLEGVACCLGFVPKYMHQAVQSSDPLEQTKNIAAAFMFLFACRPRFGKPFNPILGETFQGEIGGIPVFVEQISHHPPVSAFYMRNDKFEAYGNFDMHVEMGLNAAFSKNYGLYHVHIFATGTRFVIRFPDVEVGGVMIGDRTLSLSGKGFILEQSTNTYLEYSVGKQKKRLYEYPGKLRHCDLAGGIFKVKSEFAAKALGYDMKKAYEGAKPQDILEKHSQISGKWFGDLYFDGVEYKSLKNGPFPIRCKRQRVLLPSDCLFREDIVYKRWGDNKRSNEEKEILENLQRRDKKLRTKQK